MTDHILRTTVRLPLARREVFAFFSDAGNLACNQPNLRDPACIPALESEMFDQMADVVAVAVGVLASEAAGRVIGTRLEIGRAVIHAIGMLIGPRAGDVMPPCGYSPLVKAALMQRPQHRIFGCSRRIDIITALRRRQELTVFTDWPD